MEKTSKILLKREEEENIARKIMVWLNTCPEKPGTILYEELQADVTGMVMSVIPGAYITAQYIDGGYKAEYQFQLIYRIKPGASMDKRLKADETLDRIGDWAQDNPPDLGKGISVGECRRTTPSSKYASYENGDEDHVCSFRLNYEVI